MRRRAPDATNDFFPGFADVVEIGSGVLTTTYRAREVGAGRDVALKLINVGDVSADALAAYDRDTSVFGALREHPNIASLYGWFRTQDGRPVRVLELSSSSLLDLLLRAGALPVRDVISLGVKIAGALESAHRGGLLHRDIGPQSVLVTGQGQPALDDFGLAALQPSAEVTTVRSLAAASHHAPEQFADGVAGPATDVYALASTLYELLAGQPAFQPRAGEPPSAVLHRIVSDPVPALTVRQAPPRLSDLLARAMGKDMRARPSVVEFASQLGEVEADLQWPRTKILVHGPTAPPPPTGSSVIPPAGGWTPPPASSWFPPSAAAAPPPSAPTPSAAAPPSAPSTDWSEPTRSAPRHARPDDEDQPAAVEPVPSVEDTVARPAAPPQSPDTDVPPDGPEPPVAPDPADAPHTRGEDGLTGDEYARFEAAAAYAPLTTINPIPTQPPAASGGWSDASLSTPAAPPPRPRPAQPAAPRPEPAAVQLVPDELTRARPSVYPNAAPIDAAPHAAAGRDDDPYFGADRTDLVDTSLARVDPGETTAHPAWRQAQVAADAPDVASPHAAPGPELGLEPDVGQTVARYPIPPAPAEGAAPPPAAVPAWAFREPAPAAAPPPFTGDLTLDPTTLRRRVTIRSGAHAVVFDDSRLVVRDWLRRTELAWPDVLGFEPRFDGVGESGSGGRLVAITRHGPVELPGTQRSMADLRYVQALLDAYRQRAEMALPGH